MKIIITEDYEEMSEKAFAIVKQTVVNDPTAVLGLATGSTPLGLYARMVADCKENGTSYARVKCVNLDEYRGLDKSHVQSYAYFMRKNLFDGIDVDPDNTYIENGTASDAQAECRRYEEILRMYKPDLQILGIGSNGHIAFNEPGTPFDSGVHVVRLAESTVNDNSRMFADKDEVPREAFTMGLKNIMEARKILVLANGSNKSDALYGLVKGPVTEQLPASILQRHADCVVICDRAAARRIV